MPTVQITPQMREKCHNFAVAVIHGNNQYDRLPVPKKKRIERTFVGKLAEYAFLYYLRTQGIDYPEGDMFQIFNGQENADKFDFKVNNRKTIDIKCASKPNHKMIMIPIDQFQNMPKDYYVGIKLNSKLDNNDFILVDSITQATIYGYCNYQRLELKSTKNYSEGDCKSIFLSKLNNINKLINLF